MDQQITTILEKARSDRLMPGAIVGYVTPKARSVVVSGKLTYNDSAPLVTGDSVYDVASITKSIPLALLAHQALEEGRLALDIRLVDILPDFTGTFHDQITIWNLLTYTAIWNFPDGTGAVAKEGAKSLIKALKYRPLVAPPGERYFYTNAPAIVLGMILEKIYSKPFYELAHEKVLQPLNMNGSTFDPVRLPVTKVAPTEIVNGKVVRKTVHDESARALQRVGRQPAHAGLFSTASDLLKACEMILNHGQYQERQFLSSPTIEAMVANQLETLGARTGLGWEMDETLFREDVYRNSHVIGKTGFSGCLIAMDLQNKSAFVMLSNAKYPDRSTTRSELDTVRTAIARTLFYT